MGTPRQSEADKIRWKQYFSQLYKSVKIKIVKTIRPVRLLTAQRGILQTIPKLSRSVKLPRQVCHQKLWRVKSS